MKTSMAFVAGILFGLGLMLSGMTDPSRVLGFLDLAGDWNPSLAFVLAGAVFVGAIAFRFAGTRTQSWLGEAMRMPTATQIDRRLVLGGLAFGVGWGLAGYCPGPALASLFQGDGKPVLFVLAMLAGMGIHEMHERLAISRSRPAGANTR